MKKAPSMTKAASMKKSGSGQEAEQTSPSQLIGNRCHTRTLTPQPIFCGERVQTET